MQLRQQNSHDPEHVAIVFSFLDDFNIVVNPIVVLKVRLEKRASQNLMHDNNANKKYYQQCCPLHCRKMQLSTSNVTVVTEVQSTGFGLVFHVQFYICVYVSCLLVCGDTHAHYYNTVIMLRLLFIIELGIARFLCTMRVFEVWASPSPPRLPLCQILFLLRPPLLS